MTPVRDLPDLEDRTYASVSNVITRIFQNTGWWFNTGWTFSRATNGRFMEHKVKKSQFSVFVAFGFIYRFILVQKL